MNDTKPPTIKDGGQGSRFLRISENIMENPKLADIFDEHGNVVYVVWLHFLCAAKRANCLGRIVAPPVRVARLIGADVATTTAIIEALAQRKSIVPVEGGRDHEWQIKNWPNWQSMIPSERAKKHRMKAANTNPDVTATDTDETIEEKRREEKRREDQEHMSETKVSDRPNIKEVFAHWATLEANSGGIQKPRLTADRIRKIGSRLREGYTVEQLKTAVTGYMTNDFNLGKNDTKTRYTSIDLLFRNGDKVEAGLNLAAKNANGNGYEYLDD